MKSFESYKGVIRDKSLWDERALVNRYNIIQKTFQLIGHDLQDDFIDHITAANGSKVSHIARFGAFRDEGNTSFINMG